MKIPGYTLITRIVIQLFFLLVTMPVSGQNGNLLRMNSVSDYGDINISSLIDLQTDYIKNLYSKRIEAPKELINGKEYESYYSRSKIKPLLYLNKERTASIITKTRRYNNLTLQYDTFLDEVIYTDTSRTFNYRFPQIALNKNIIDGFNLYFNKDSITFRYFRLPECSKYNLTEGFYEIVYEAKSQFIIKHESTFYVREALNNYKYSPKNYISVNNTFIKIKTNKELLALLGDKSEEVKQYMRKYGIKIRKADKGQILRVIKFYDSLVTSEG